MYWDHILIFNDGKEYRDAIRNLSEEEVLNDLDTGIKNVSHSPNINETDIKTL